MRLRDISDRLREVLEGDPATFFGENMVHALVQDVQDVQAIYRPIAGASRKAGLQPWLTFSFEPFSGLLEPFGAYPSRFWAMVRMHRQSSGLPELVTFVSREMPNAREPIAPDLYASFSHSPKVQSVIRRRKEADALQIFHRGGLMTSTHGVLPIEQCIPGFGEALPEGFTEDNIPGLVDLDGVPMLFLGELLFYNNFRTPARPELRTFVLNCVASALVARYVRDSVTKSMDEA